MPLFRVANKLFQHDAEGKDLIVRGNQIPFLPKKEGSFIEIKGLRVSASDSAPHKKNLQCTTNSRIFLDEAVDGQYAHAIVSRRVKPKFTRTVDRGVQVDDIEKEVNLKNQELSTGMKTVLKKTLPSVEFEGIKEQESVSDLTNQRFIFMEETEQRINNSGLEKDFAATLQEKELSFARQLKGLADECNSDPPSSLDLKDSTYVVLKEQRGIVLVHFPNDLQSEDPVSLAANALLETGDIDDGDDDDDDEIDLRPQNSLSLLSFESSPSTPVPLIRRKTLYPEPCPAFPMEVSFPPFPPVEFD